MDGSPQILVSLKDYTLIIGDTTDNIPILEDINIDIQTNSFVGIIGASGSGKTMLLRSFIQLFENLNSYTVEGQILYYSGNSGKTNILYDPTGDKLYEIRTSVVSYVSQQSALALNPSKRIKNIFEEFSAGIDSDVSVDQVLASVGFQDSGKVLTKYVHEFSGGQVQRLLIALALMVPSKLMLVDEPTSNLDAALKTEIMQLLEEIKLKYKKAIVLVSHNMPLVSEYTDYLYVLEKGKIVEQGRTDQIMTNPQSEAAKSLVQRGIQSQSDKSASDEVILSLKSASFSYQKPSLFRKQISKWIIDDLSLEVKHGEILGIVGPSGSGKSTLAGLLSALQWPQRGSLYYKGHQVDQMDKNAWKIFRRKIQMIFQDAYAAIPPHYTAYQFIKEAFKAHGTMDRLDRASIAAYLLEFDLDEDLLDRQARRMSGGQRQRLLIARALTAEPEVLICDEILSSLDTHVSKKVLNFLSELHARTQLTIIFISHDAEIVEAISDRMIEIAPSVYNPV